jgi:hypothetical protein
VLSKWGWLEKRYCADVPTPHTQMTHKHAQSSTPSSKIWAPLNPIAPARLLEKPAAFQPSNVHCWQWLPATLQHTHHGVTSMSTKLFLP